MSWVQQLLDVANISRLQHSLFYTTMGQWRVPSTKPNSRGTIVKGCTEGNKQLRGTRRAMNSQRTHRGVCCMHTGNCSLEWFIGKFNVCSSFSLKAIIYNDVLYSEGRNSSRTNFLRSNWKHQKTFSKHNTSSSCGLWKLHCLSDSGLLICDWTTTL